MSAVDVLAVMDRLVMLATDKNAGGHEARMARAAVAELIDACNEEEHASEACSAAMSREDKVRAGGRLCNALRRKRAALARCKGEQA